MPNISLSGPDGAQLARDNWVIAFFLPNPFPLAASAVRTVFDLWRESVPVDDLQWGLVGASAEEVKPLGKKTLDRCAAMLDPTNAEKREITAFTVLGPNSDVPDHLFNVVGDRTPGKGFSEGLAGLVEVWFPTGFRDAAAVVEFARRCAEVLPYVSGYAAPALATGPGGDDFVASPEIAGLALRHHGYDVPRNEDTRFHLKGRVVGARWLTFLGPALVEQLGGQAAIAAAVQEVTVAPSGQGLLLRAGDEPEIGDTNRRVEVSLLRAMATALEPVTCFGNRAMETVFGNDHNALDQWERRLLT